MQQQTDKYAGLDASPEQINIWRALDDSQGVFARSVVLGLAFDLVAALGFATLDPGDGSWHLFPMPLALAFGALGFATMAAGFLFYMMTPSIARWQKHPDLVQPVDTSEPRH